MSRRERSGLVFPQAGRWLSSTSRFMDEVDGPHQKLEDEIRKHLRKGYRLFFETVRPLRGVRAEVPYGIDDLENSARQRVVTFNRSDSRIVEFNGEYPFGPWSPDEWQVTIRGYKKNAKSDNPDYYKENTDERAVVILYPQGREFDRIMFDLQFSRPKKPEEPFSYSESGLMQIGHDVEVLARGSGAELKQQQSGFSKRTELEVLRLVNSLAQIFAHGANPHRRKQHKGIMLAWGLL